MADLRTTYLGLELPSPLVASASPLTAEIGSLRALADAGAGAVVLPSLFEEELTHGPETTTTALWHAGDEPGEASGYLASDLASGNAEAYATLVAEAKRELEIPVIASLNGSTPGGWTRYAELLQQAGADAIELNVYSVEPDIETSAGNVEDRLLRLVSAVRTVVSVPVAVKLSPYYSAFANVAHRLVGEGARGLVLFNRFVQPDIDIEALDVRSELQLSTSAELRLRLRWLALLHGRTDAGLAATGGVATGEDVVKAILAGADVVMTASALMREGTGYLGQLRSDLDSWLDERGDPSVSAVRGRVSQIACGNPRAFERAQYVRAVASRV
jgi:dihydroorotate dehydrogenase (fumarate)